MKRIATIIAMAAVLLGSLGSAHAEKNIAEMLFLYPGEAGSTAEAQPILDLFEEYLDDRIAPYDVEMVYYNDLEKGLAYLKEQMPQLGIVSYAAWTQHRIRMGDAIPWLATVPLPGGQQFVRYALVGRASSIAGCQTIFASEPMTADFVRSELFADLPANASVVQSGQVLHRLRRMGEGTGKAGECAILTPTEAATLGHLSAPWAKALSVIAQSQYIPSARVVIFDPVWRGYDNLKKALLRMSKDSEAKALLQELRLKGFAEIKQPAKKKD